MRVLLYEWCCSGGLSGPDAARLFSDAAAQAGFETVDREGRSMLEALAADAAKDSSLEVTVLVEKPPAICLPPTTQVRKVAPASEMAALVEAARAADWTIIVAPETAGILQARVAAARRAGGRVLAPGERFISVASDKQATIDALAATGVPVPAGRSLAPGEDWPRGFHVPAVRKARASMGCDQLVIVRAADQLPIPSMHATRLEAFVEGTPVGVSCLCGPHAVHLLPPLVQRFSPGPRPSYQGGMLLADKRLATRAEQLARRSLAALAGSGRSSAPPPGRESAALGWVGVDMVLASGDDGRGDRVLEVNPRVTTSFVGLTSLFPQSLVRTMIDAAAGRVTDVASALRNDRALEFDTTGRVRVTDGSG